MFGKMIEITTGIGCPLDCIYCPQKVLIDAYNDRIQNYRLMSYDTFRECIDKIPKEVDIHFSGMCEPWINPECSGMVDYAAHKGHRIHIFTTLVGFKEEDIQLLKKIHLDTFIIHIPDENNFSKFPKSVDYFEIFKKVLREVKEGKLPLTAFSCHGSTLKSIEQMINDIGVPILTRMNDRAGNLNKHIENIPSYLYERDPIQCKFCGGNSLDKNVLMPDGSVYLCCMDYSLEYPLGNLLFDDYSIISDGMLKKEYRKRLVDWKRGAILCRKCIRAELLGEIDG